MNNNKSYFFHAVLNNGTQIAGVGYAIFNVNLRAILGYKYEMYDAFNISMEAFLLEGGSLQNQDNSNFCVHIRGFPWMNNYYDSLQQYSDSRVIEVCSSNSAEDEERDIYGAYFQKNIHQIAFYKPSTPVIPQFTTFITTPSGVFWEKLTNTTLGYMCCFAITGIDRYRTKDKLYRPLVYRSYNKGNPMLVLNSAYATSIDPIDTTAFKKRIFQFNNVNWRQVIGNDLYDKYNKFALVSSRLSCNYESFTYGNGNFIYPLYLNASNLVWEQVTNYFVGNASQTTQLHGGKPVYIGMLRTNIGSLRHLKDCYIENVFYKPTQDVGSITIHWSSTSTVSLVSGGSGPNLASNFPFPTLVAQFEIIPLVD